MPSNRPRRRNSESAKRDGNSRHAPLTGAALLAPRPLAADPTRPLPAVFLRTPTWHPIIYRKRVAKVDPSAKAGDLVAVYTGEQELLGYGIYNSRSEFAVRLMRLGRDLPDDAFWQDRLQQAIRLRRDTLRLDEATDAYRVLHAEADGFSGLVVDKLGDTLSAEAFSLGMFQRAGEILGRLAPLLGTRHTLVQAGPQSLSQEGFAADPAASEELPSRVTIQEF